MLKVYLDGNFHTNVASPDELQQQADFAGVDISRLSIPADELAAFYAAQVKAQVRTEIVPLAGDTQSIQGTIADNVGLLLEELGRFMARLDMADDVADIKAAAQPLANDLAPLVAAVDSGDCILTHHVKGKAQVVTDACTRSNAVASVLIAHATPQ